MENRNQDYTQFINTLSENIDELSINLYFKDGNIFSSNNYETVHSIKPLRSRAAKIEDDNETDQNKKESIPFKLGSYVCNKDYLNDEIINNENFLRRISNFVKNQGNILYKINGIFSNQETLVRNRINFHNIKEFEDCFKQIVKQEIRNSIVIVNPLLINYPIKNLKFNDNLVKLINMSKNIYIKTLVDEAFRDIGKSGELNEITKIDASNLGLKHFPDISELKNLQILDCSYNQLTSLVCPNKISINCIFNQLTLLFSPNATDVFCSFNKLKLFVCTKAIRVNCFNNELTSLYCPNAVNVICSGNKLTSLYCPNVTDEVDCSHNQLKSINFPSAANVNCSANKLVLINCPKAKVQYSDNPELLRIITADVDKEIQPSSTEIKADINKETQQPSSSGFADREVNRAQARNNQVNERQNGCCSIL